MKYFVIIPWSIHFRWHLTHFSKALPGLKISQTSPVCCSDNCSVELGSVSRLRFNTIFSQTFITYFLTPWSEVPLEKLTRSQLVKKFPEFHGDRRFITAFTSARQLSLSWARLMQSITPTSHFLKILLNIIIPSMTGFSKWSLPLRFSHQNRVCTTALPHSCYMPRPSHYSRFDNQQYWASSTVHSSLHNVVFFIHLLPSLSWAQIFSSTPYSQTPSAYVPP